MERFSVEVIVSKGRQGPEECVRVTYDSQICKALPRPMIPKLCFYRPLVRPIICFYPIRGQVHVFCPYPKGHVSLAVQCLGTANAKDKLNRENGALCRASLRVLS